MERFEYKVLTFNPTPHIFSSKLEIDEMQNELDKLGFEGWELVNSIAMALSYGETNEIIAIFKRRMH